MTALLFLLAGCAPQPASIKFDGKPEVVVHTKDAVAVQKATVLDKDGKAIDPQPTLTWKVDPATVAKYDANKVTPVGNGEATVEASTGTVKGTYKFKVAFPDKVEIAGYSAPVGVGATVNLTASVMAGADKVDGQTIAWMSSDETKAKVDASGVVTGVAEGTATITASAGDLKATQDVTVGAAAATADAKPADPKAAGKPEAKPAEVKKEEPKAAPVVTPPPGQGKGRNR